MIGSSRQVVGLSLRVHDWRFGSALTTGSRIVVESTSTGPIRNDGLIRASACPVQSRRSAIEEARMATRRQRLLGNLGVNREEAGVVVVDEVAEQPVVEAGKRPEPHVEATRGEGAEGRIPGVAI